MESEAEMYKNTITSTGDNRRRVRNPEATCATCPYCWMSRDNQFRECRKKSAAITTVQSSFPQVSEYDWCGEHPDFWMEEVR